MQTEVLEQVMQAIPKAELHLHLEGAVPWEWVRQQSDEALPERPDWWDRDHRFESFGEFVSAIRPTWRPYLKQPEEISSAVSVLYGELRAQNVRYLEVSFGLGAYVFPVSEVVRAIQEPAPSDLTVRVIAGISRDRDLETMVGLAGEAVGTDELDGIDLHGDESVGELWHFSDMYLAARERGMIVKAHAGELGGPESVQETLRVLQVNRIEHGIAAVRDPNVVQVLKDQGTILDVCPWSNVKLKVVPDLKTHPIRALYEAGVCVTVNTDDPTVFGQTLTDEYRWLVAEMGLGLAEVGDIARNGWRAANVSEEVRAGFLHEIDCLLAG